MGQIFFETGVDRNKEYGAAINVMPCPINKKDLLRFLGKVKFVSKLIPNLSWITASVRQLD